MNFASEHLGQKPIEFFFPKLATIDSVVTALRKEFGDHASSIITKLKEGQALVDDELSAHDTIVELVSDKSEVIKTLRDRRQESELYPEIYINIMRFGLGSGHYVYWIGGMEIDDDGYFESMETAMSYADIMYLT